jgi:hypothetical protein
MTRRMTSLPTLAVVSGPLGAGKTTLAHRLEPLRGLARIRIVHCVVDADTAFQRSLGRSRQNPLRAAHADPGPDDAAERVLAHERFQRVALNAPSLEVNTTDGYRPGLGEIAGFVTG